jgi:hypothetical protein
MGNSCDTSTVFNLCEDVAFTLNKGNDLWYVCDIEGAGNLDLSGNWNPIVGSNLTIMLLVGPNCNSAVFQGDFTDGSGPGATSGTSGGSTRAYIQIHSSGNPEEPTQYNGTFRLMLDGGCGGDPHFVGFDGSQFDFNGIPNNHYLLWRGNGLEVVGFFGVNRYIIDWWPNGTTFITKLVVRNRGRKYVFDDSFSNGLNHHKNDRAESVGLANLPPTVLGRCGQSVVGSDQIRFDNGTVIVSNTRFKNQFNHLSATIRLNNPKNSYQATGIIGQTLRPKWEQVANESFLVPLKI